MKQKQIKQKKELKFNWLGLQPSGKKKFNPNNGVYNKPFNFNRQQPKPRIQPVQLMQPVKMNSNSVNFWGAPLERKESIRAKHLSPYNDADMDGSPNKFDCNPRNASQDGLFSAIAGMARTVKAAVTGKRDVARLEEKGRAEKVASKQRRVEKSERRVEAAQEKIFTTDIVKKREAQKKLKAAEYATEEKQAKLEEAQRKYKLVGIKLQQKNIKTFKRGAVGLAGALLPLPKQIKARGYNPTKVSNLSGKKYAKAGRPSGPSGRYVIPNVGAVGVYQYRAWLKTQNKIRRQIPQQYAQQQSPPQRYVPYTQSSYPSSSVQAAAVLSPSQQLPSIPDEMQMEEAQVQQQPQQQTQQITPAQIEMLRQMQLEQEQRNDNILNAPNIMAGEMVQKVHRGIIVPHILNAPNFMTGQLRQKIKNSEVGTVNEYGEVQVFDNSNKLGPAPIDNPQGNTYMDVNLISGQLSNVKKRPSEAWLDGRAK